MFDEVSYFHLSCKPCMCFETLFLNLCIKLLFDLLMKRYRFQQLENYC